MFIVITRALITGALLIWAAHHVHISVVLILGLMSISLEIITAVIKIQLSILKKLIARNK